MATTKVSLLTAKTTPTGTEELLINDGGTSKKITQTNLLSTALPLAGGTMTGNITLGTNTIDGLEINTTATNNLGLGTGTVDSITTGDYNVGVGDYALSSVDAGSNNTAIGYVTLNTTTSGNGNTSAGFYSLVVNTAGSNNVASGFKALQANTTASGNTGIGYFALAGNTTGINNVALGYQAGSTNTTGSSNIIIGDTVNAASATASNQLNIGNWIKGTAGEIHIPGASGVGIAPTAAKLEVFTSADTETVGQFKNGTGSATATIVKIISARADVVHALQCFNASTTETFRIAATGNVLNLNNSYGALSDIKLKENVVDATPKLADIMKVKVRNYNLIGDTTKQLGVIAQELETVFPSMVDESIDRTEDGEMLDTTTKSVKYSVFVPVLLKSLQEAVAKIEALEARITLLETP